MARKKSNRVSLELHKKAFRQNQAAIAKALAQNAELEKAITEEENLEIVGIIRKYRVGIDNLEQIMQGVRPTGESLFFEEKQKPVSPEEEAELLTPKKAKENQAGKLPKPAQELEKEESEHEQE